MFDWKHTATSTISPIVAPTGFLRYEVPLQHRDWGGSPHSLGWFTHLGANHPYIGKCSQAWLLSQNDKEEKKERVSEQKANSQSLFHPPSCRWR